MVAAQKMFAAKPKAQITAARRTTQHAQAELRRRRVRLILERTRAAIAQIDAQIGEVRTPRTEPLVPPPPPKGRRPKGSSRRAFLAGGADVSATSYSEPAMTLPQAPATAVLDLDLDLDLVLAAERVACTAGITLDSLFEAVIARSLPSLKLGRMPAAKCACCADGRCQKAFMFRGAVRCGCDPLKSGSRTRATGNSATKT